MSELSASDKTINDVARRIYEDRHASMSNVWSWDDNGLDDEHPGTRELYQGYARSAIDAAVNAVQDFALEQAAPGFSNASKIKSALNWYAEQAEAMARYSAAKNTDAMIAVVSALSLDAGNRAAAALSTPTSQP